MSFSPDFAQISSAVIPTVAAPDTFMPAQPGVTAVVVTCPYEAYEDAPTLAAVRVDYPAVFAWRIRPPASRNHKLTVEPVLAGSPYFADVPGQGVVVEILVPDDATPGSPLRSRMHNRTTLDTAKSAVLAEARARWRRERHRAERQAARRPVPMMAPERELEPLAA